MPECLRQRFAHRLFWAMDSCCRCAFTHGQGQRQKSGAGDRQGDQCARPGQQIDQSLSQRHHGKLAKATNCACQAERPATPIRRHHSAKRAINHPERSTGEGDAYAQSRRQRERQWRRGHAHPGETDGIENQSGNNDAQRPKPVGQHAGKRLGQTPDQVLHGNGESEGLARPAVTHRNRHLKYSCRVPNPQRQPHDQAACHDIHPSLVPPASCVI